MGLRIKPVHGSEFTVTGNVTYRYYDGKKIYYCAGQSWPAEIVVEVLK